MREDVFGAVWVGTAKSEGDDLAAAFFNDSGDEVERKLPRPKDEARGEILASKM